MTHKLCSDCKHFDGDAQYAPKCNHETATHLDQESLVRGPVSNVQWFCSAVRSGICGVEAKHFEPRLKEA